MPNAFVAAITRRSPEMNDCCTDFFTSGVRPAWKWLQGQPFAFVTALERNGGELAVRTPVTRILVEDGKVAGVELEDGRTIRAPLVVSNADARHTFQDMIGLDQLPTSYAKRPLVFDSFEDQGWPSCIDDPLPRKAATNRKKRRRAVIQALNRGQHPRRIWFRADGTSEGIRWEAVT